MADLCEECGGPSGGLALVGTPPNRVLVCRRCLWRALATGAEPLAYVVAISACEQCSRPIRLVDLYAEKRPADERAAELAADLARADVPLTCARAEVLKVHQPTAGLHAWVRGRHG